MKFKTILAILQSKDDAARVLKLRRSAGRQARGASDRSSTRSPCRPRTTAVWVFPTPASSRRGTEIAASRRPRIEAIFTGRQPGGLSGECGPWKAISATAPFRASKAARFAPISRSRSRDPDSEIESFCRSRALLSISGRPALFFLTP